MFSKKRTYLDYAAGKKASPSSPHEEGRAAGKQLEDARAKIAQLAEVKADDVIFTSSATEANALAILGLGRPGAHMLYLPSAHASITENMRMAAMRGVRVEPLSIKGGRIEVEALAKLLLPETVLISMEAVCGETGTVWNTREVAHLVQKSSHAYIHVDASQAPYTEKITRSHFGADLVTFDGGKLGARGIAALIAHRTIPLTPLYRGGGQERGLRSGTENVEAAETFSKKLSRAASERDAFTAHTNELRTILCRFIQKSIPDAYINEGAKNAPHILNFSLPGRDTDYLVALLDEAGFAVSTKSACESTNGEGSRAVLALTNDEMRGVSSLRVSWDLATSRRAIERFSKALIKAVRFVDSMRT